MIELTSVEKLQLKQEGKCADCGSYEMTTEDQGGLKCHECNKLYCSNCYRKTHFNHNLHFWYGDFPKSIKPLGKVGTGKTNQCEYLVHELNKEKKEN